MKMRFLIWSLTFFVFGCAASSAQKSDTTKTKDSNQDLIVEELSEDTVKVDSSKNDKKLKSEKPVKKSNYNEDLTVVRPVFEPEVIVDTNVTNGDDSVKVEVTDMEVTHEIDSIKKRVGQYNRQHPPKLHGYRIQVYSGGSQLEAQKSVRISKEVLGNDIYNKVQWSSPVFRTRVGCFISRLEAYKAFRLLEKDFPNALVVPDNEIDPNCVK